jgi:hypothetical protein
MVPLGKRLFSQPSTKSSSTLVQSPKRYTRPKSPRRGFARSLVSGRGQPITSGTSLGRPAFGTGKMSIGDNVSMSQTAHAVIDGRRSARPLLQHIRQSRVPVVRVGQRPVLARNDPLNIFGRQRQQTLLIAAAECRKKILHNLDFLLCSHRNLSIPLPSDRVRSFYSKLTLGCLPLLEPNSQKSIFCSGPTSARQLSYSPVFFPFLSRLDLHTPY